MSKWENLENNNTYDMRSWSWRIERLSGFIGEETKSVLDVGCGECYLSTMLKQRDIKYYSLDYLPRREDTIVCDLNNKEFTDIQVDCVFCSGCCEYITDIEWLADRFAEIAQKEIVISYTATEYYPKIAKRREKAYQHDLTVESFIKIFTSRGFLLTQFESATCGMMKFEREENVRFESQALCIGCGICKSVSDIADKKKLCPLHKKKRVIKESDNYVVQGLNAQEWDRNVGLILSEIFGHFSDEKKILVFPTYDGNLRKIKYFSISDLENNIADKLYSGIALPDFKEIIDNVEIWFEKNDRVVIAAPACQLSALKNYVNHFGGENISKLVTVEICEGYLPDNTELSGYIDDFLGEETIENLQRISLEAVQWVEHYPEYSQIKRSKYLSAMNKGVLRKDNCELCKYKNRGYGDIRIIYENGKMNLSGCTKKGKVILAESSVSIGLEAQDCTRAVRKTEPLRCNENKARYDSLKKKHSNKELLEYALGKYDIAYVGWYSIDNYGAELTHYALYQFLNDNGYEVLMVQMPSNSRRKPTLKPRLFRINPYPEYDLAKIYSCKAEMYELNSVANAFIVGSDQLWKQESFDKCDKVYDLDFVEDGRKKIAYATSFGYEDYRGDDKGLAYMKNGLKRFTAISTREKSGIEVCKRDFDVPAVMCMDPVFICDRQHYIDLTKRSDREFNRVCAFFLDLTHEKLEVIKAVAKHYNSDFSVITDNKPQLDSVRDYIDKNCMVEDWIKMIMECDVVITDSFHASCIAIIFNKTFITIADEVGRVGSRDRIMSLFSTIGLESRALENVSDIEGIIKQLDVPINYENVNAQLAREIYASENWLLDNLKKNGGYKGKDLVWNRLAKADYEIVNVKNDAEKKQKKINALTSQLEQCRMNVKQNQLYIDSLEKKLNELSEENKQLSSLHQEVISQIEAVKGDFNSYKEMNDKSVSRIKKDIKVLNSKKHTSKRKMIKDFVKKILRKFKILK